MSQPPSQTSEQWAQIAILLEQVKEVAKEVNASDIVFLVDMAKVRVPHDQG
jgi:hypothetical protein